MRYSKKPRIFLLISFLLLSTGLTAQHIKFVASASGAPTAGEPFELRYSLNAEPEEFAPPSLPGLQVVGGPNMSSSMTSINGNTTAEISYSYYVVAPREGNYNVGAATVKIGGRPYRSNSLRIKVLRGGNVPRTQQPAQEREEQTISQDAVKPGENLFLRAVPGKTTVYQGERLNLDFKLYTQVSVLDLQADKVPDMNGFWAEEIKNNNQQAQISSETYIGRLYKVATLKQSILFPERAGQLNIDPMEITTLVRQQAAPRSIMDQFFGGNYEDVKYQLKSPTVKIRVKPLPEAGKPAGFDGAVGKFVLSTRTDKSEVRANEAINLSITIRGNGNLKLLKSPDLKLPPDIERYDPKISDTINVDENGVYGSRTFTFLLIPRNEGKYEIPAYQFSFFDPEKGRYVTTSGEAIGLNVLKGDPAASQVYSSGQSSVSEKNKDIAYIRTGSTDLFNKEDSFFGSVLFYVLLCTPLLLIFAAWGYKRWTAVRNGDPLAVKSRKAAAIANRHLAAADSALSTGRKAAFYEAVSRGMYGYLADRFNISNADLNKEAIEATLRGKNVPEALLRQVLSVLNDCEMARYAPVSDISDAVFLENAKRTVYDIEKVL